MRADVAETAPRARARRIDTPAGLLVPRLFQLGGEPILDILRLDDADGTQLARGHHLARLAHHRVSRVVVRDAEHESGAPHQAHEIECVLDGRGHRLVADHVDAVVEKDTGDRMVAVVRRHDADDLDPVGAFRFGRRHRGKARVHPVRRETQIGARVPRPLGIRRQCARDQLVLPVQPGAQAVHGADERAATAPDHAEPERARRGGVGGRFDHQATPSMRRLAATSVPAPAKSSNACSVTRMMWSAMNFAPSRAPSSGCLRQHSHSSTAQPG